MTRAATRLTSDPPLERRPPDARRGALLRSRVVLALMVASAAPAAYAQEGRHAARPVPELRVDALVARRTAVHGGLGASVALGNYVRAEAIGAGGALLRAGGPQFSTRAELLAHFLLDPFGEFARSPYVGGGVSVRHDDARTRGSLVIVVGAEWQRARGYAPAVEIGLGGGVRVGLVLRRVRAAGR